MKTETSFNSNMRRLRESNDMTQRQLGEALGVGWLTISRWERGVSEPSFAKIEQMANLFNVTVSDLFATKEAQQ